MGQSMGQVGAEIGAKLTYGKLATAMGVMFVDVTVVLDFVNLNASKESLLDRISGGSQSATVKSNVSPTVVSGRTQLNYIGSGTTNVRLTLEQPLVMTGEAIAETRDANTTADTVSNVGNVAHNAVMLLERGKAGTSAKISRKEAVAAPSYTDVVGQNIDALGRAFASVLK